MASTYDLELLEDLINVTLDPSTILYMPANSKQFAEWENFVSSESVRIKKRMKAVVSRAGKERDIERYIQRNQQDIIALKNRVVQYLVPKTFKDLELQQNETPLNRLYKAVFHILKGLLEYLEEFFRQYFNLDEYMPASYLMRSRYFLKQRIKTARKKIGETGINGKFTYLLFAPLDRFCATKEKKVSYRSFLYIRKLIKELEIIANERNETILSLQKKLTEITCYMNYNSSDLVNYIIADIIACINALPDQLQKTEKLAEYLKEINQINEKPGIAFKPKVESVKSRITAWLSEEMYFMEQKQRLLFIVEPKSEAALPDDEKLHFSTSVEVLTLLARSAKDSRLILNKQSTTMYKSLVKFVRTTHSESLSANSLLKKGYVAERSAKQTAINILHEMIKHIHKY